MASINFIEQLIESMEDSVLKLEKAVDKKDFDEANRLKAFVFDLHLQIKKALTGENNV